MIPKMDSLINKLKKPPFSRLCLILIAAFFLLPTSSAAADIGPKPNMEFTLEYEAERIPIIAGELIECDDPACLTGSPLGEVGPQHFSCSAYECSSLAYGYADYHKLVIQFEDRIRESNVFSHQGFNAKFTVKVTETSLTVEEVRGISEIIDDISLRRCICGSGFLGTIILETLIASAYLAAFHLPRTILGFIPLASVITLPVVWFAFPQMDLPFFWIVLISEVFAITFEAGILFFGARKRISFKHILILSLIMNTVSFSIGLLLSI
ncbi:MAG: hypothetical protein MUO76_21610 [Anaerolineaceae bacterium]|nr:hypothetical protein [Anaerolineaceae bacterium]